MDTKPPIDALYPVPLSLEGHCVLHQMMHFHWAEWRKLDGLAQEQIAKEAAAAFSKMEAGGGGQSAVFSMLGHKSDLMLIHLRKGNGRWTSTEKTAGASREWSSRSSPQL